MFGERIRRDWASIEFVQLPVALALLLVVLTWMVWQSTDAPCWAGFALDRECPTRVAAFINVGLMREMLLNGGIVFVFANTKGPGS